MPKTIQSRSEPRWQFVTNKVVDNIYFFNDEASFDETSGSKRTKATFAASQEFIDSVRQDIQDGYGFVPFIGAGFSVTAGIPIIAHLLSYLQRCICMSLGITGEPDEPGATGPRWNPRTDRWPPFVDRTRAYAPRHWEGLVLSRFQSALAPEHARIYQLALGMMSEWRTALDFLSRVSVPRSRAPLNTVVNHSLHFCEPDRAIVDACFREVMRNKRPSMNHRMLAALNPILRIDLILTTNFDNLTEKAFDEYQSPLTSFDVHLNDTLPDYTAVSRSSSIIKLHGSLRSLRADFSLDGPPTEEDRKSFREYLAGKIPTEYEPTLGTPIRAKNHLLMMGVAASEQRTVQFIKDALKHISDLKLYWLCYSAKEVNAVHAAFQDCGLCKSDGTPRIRVLRHTNVGLLFLHLYQSVRKSLPSHGALFPSTTRIPIPPLPHIDGDGESNSEYVAFRDDLMKALSTKPQDGSGPSDRGTSDVSPLQGHEGPLAHSSTELGKFIVATSDFGVNGVAPAAAEVFRVLEIGNNCLWLDMNDIHTVDDLFEAFLEAGFQRLGEADWTPLYKIDRRYSSQPGDRSRTDAARKRVSEGIARLINSSNQPWYLFINAREVPGANRPGGILANGWMDNRASFHKDETRVGRRYEASADAFCDLVQSFTTASGTQHNNKIHLILLCHSAFKAQSALQTLLVETFGHEPTFAKLLFRGNADRIKQEQVVTERVINWASEPDREEEQRDLRRGQEVVLARRTRRKEERRRFVQALISMQRPRHLSFAWSRCLNEHWALHSEFDDQRMKWLDDLERCGLLRRMDGGFIWLQAAFREAMRKCLSIPKLDLTECRGQASEEASETEKQNLEKSRGEAWERINEACGFWPGEEMLEHLYEWNAASHQSQIHLGLSTWCRKVLDATGAAPAVFELVEHLCWSARWLMDRESFLPGPDGVLKAASGDDLLLLAAKRISTARELLREHLFLIQTQGHSGATLRRLGFIQDMWSAPPLEDAEDSATQAAPSTPCGPAFPLGIQQSKLCLQIAKLQTATAETSRAICREVAEDGDAFEYLREAAVRRMSTTPLSKTEIAERLHQLQVEPTGLSRALGDYLLTETNKATRLDQHEWIRWWRWCAMLGNASRSFSAAAHSIARSMWAAKGSNAAQTYIVIPGPLDLNSNFLKGWVLNGTESHRVALETLHSLEVAAFNLSLRAHTLNRKLALTRYSELEAGQPDAEDVLELNRTAGEFAVKGLQMVEQILNDGAPHADHDFELQWCKSRLLMLAGVAVLSTPEMKYTSRHAMSFLGDAATALNATTPDRGRADLAIVELRRAEVRLHEAAAERLFDDPSGSTRAFCDVPFEAWTYDCLDGDGVNADVSWIIRDGGDPYLRTQLDVARLVKKDLAPASELQQRMQAKLLRIRARTTDAIRFLDQAEPILRERRRNVFWTTWYFERRLRAMSLMLWATVFDTGSPIPHLGLEAARYDTETDADSVLKDALRMIRMDSHRMALVVLSYASCARALEVRLALEDDAQLRRNMLPRLLRMRQDLDEAAQQLQITIDSRGDFGGHTIIGAKRQGEASADPTVFAVVTASQRKINCVLSGLHLL